MDPPGLPNGTTPQTCLWNNMDLNQLLGQNWTGISTERTVHSTSSLLPSSAPTQLFLTSDQFEQILVTQQLLGHLQSQPTGINNPSTSQTQRDHANSQIGISSSTHPSSLFVRAARNLSGSIVAEEKRRHASLTANLLRTAGSLEELASIPSSSLLEMSSLASSSTSLTLFPQPLSSLLSNTSDNTTKCHSVTDENNPTAPTPPFDREEFRRRPAPVLPDSFPRSETPEGFGNGLPTKNYFPTHFFQGTQIQLPNGVRKKVDDMTTDDFVLTAMHSSQLRVDTSLVTAIESNNVLFRVTFQVREASSTVQMEVRPEHPFFVIGLGWTSCNPARTLEVLGLKVNNLLVGDSVIALTPSEGQSERTTQALQSSITLRQVAMEAEEEWRVARIFDKLIKSQELRSQKRRHESLERNGRMSQPPETKSYSKDTHKRRRSMSFSETFL